MLRRLAAPTLLLAALAAPMTAGDAPAPLEIAFADGAVLKAHFDASIYAKVWKDPAVAAIRAKFEASLAEETAKLGFDPMAVLTSATGTRIRMHGMKDKEPILDFQVTLPGFAKLLLTKMVTDKSLAPVKVAGADEAFAKDGKPGTVARFGETIALAVHREPAPWKVTPTTSDLKAKADIPKLLAAIRAGLDTEQQAEMDKAVASLGKLRGLTFDGDIVAAGVHETWRMEGYQSKTGIPVDTDVLDRLPANTLMMLACAVDGKVYWDEFSAQLIEQAGEKLAPGATPEAKLAAIDQAIKDFGIDADLRSIIQGYKGTALFAVSPGAPIPSISLAIPRSEKLDAVLLALIAKAGMIAPAEGEAVLLPLGQVPVAAQLVRGKTHWIATSDPSLPTTWDQPVAERAPGWSTSKAGKAAMAKGGGTAFVIGSSDTANVIRTSVGFLQMAMGMMNGLTNEEKQSLIQALNRLAASAGTGYLIARNDGADSIMESQGLITIGGILPIAGFAGIMKEMGSDQTVEMAPVATGGVPADVRDNLVAILGAEIQFQASTLVDQDGDNIGEFGLLDELAGRRATVAAIGETKLLGGPLADGRSAGTFSFKLYLPDGKGGAITDSSVKAKRPAVKESADLQETQWIAYAWSTDGQGPTWSIGTDGAIRVSPAGAPHDAGWEPSWNEALEADWSAKATWVPTE